MMEHIRSLDRGLNQSRLHNFLKHSFLTSWIEVVRYWWTFWTYQCSKNSNKLHWSSYSELVEYRSKEFFPQISALVLPRDVSDERRLQGIFQQRLRVPGFSPLSQYNNFVLWCIFAVVRICACRWVTLRWTIKRTSQFCRWIFAISVPFFCSNICLYSIVIIAGIIAGVPEKNGLQEEIEATEWSWRSHLGLGFNRRCGPEKAVTALMLSQNGRSLSALLMTESLQSYLAFSSWRLPHSSIT